MLDSKYRLKRKGTRMRFTGIARKFAFSLLSSATLMTVQVSVAQVTDEQWDITERHDRDVRASNTAQDYFLVSTVRDGLSQIRFYIDRNIVREPDASGVGRAWVDSYEVVGSRRPIRLTHNKALLEVRCNESLPQLRFRSMVTYSADGTNTAETGTRGWEDVVPGTSMETQHRFICGPQPANAIYPVFNGNTPEKDAISYFLQQPR